MVSLKQAFKIQKDLKAEMDKVDRLLTTSGLSHLEGEEEITPKMRGRSTKELLEQSLSLKDKFLRLRIAMKTANAVNVAIIEEISTLKIKSAFLNRLIRDLENLNTFRSVEDEVTGKYTKVRVIPTLDLLDLENQVAVIEARKSELEDQLFENNSRTKIEFEG